MQLSALGIDETRSWKPESAELTVTRDARRQTRFVAGGQTSGLRTQICRASPEKRDEIQSYTKVTAK